jgi:dihydropyrimidinase
VLPGGVDVHTHPLGAIEADTAAALLGGTTTILGFVDAEPGERPAAAARRTIADELPRARCDVGLHGVIWEPDRYRDGDLRALADAGVTSVKLWLAYHELGIQADDRVLYRVLREAAREGVLASAHCENGLVVRALVEELLATRRRELRWHPVSRPAELEAEAVHRFLVLAGLAGAAAHVVHVSSRAALAEVVRGFAHGTNVSAECCPHHLVFDDARYGQPDAARFAMTPPLRTPADVDALWAALADGGLDVLASDHSHVRLEDKAADDFSRLEYGIPGVGLRLAVGLTDGVAAGRLTLERLVEVACTAPAQRFGLGDRKGALVAGLDADLAVWDPAARWVPDDAGVIDGSGYTPYAGRTLLGRPRHVLLRGAPVVEDGVLVDGAPRGAFLARPRLPRGAGHLDRALGGTG